MSYSTENHWDRGEYGILCPSCGGEGCNYCDQMGTTYNEEDALWW